MNLPDLFEEYRSQFILGLAGLFLLGVGVLSVVVLSLKQSEPKVEILSTDESSLEESGEMMVDVEGAVEKPGVYKLVADARVNDALVAAGGLSAEADREWISRYINLAQPLKDGIKVYIPFIDERADKGLLTTDQSGAKVQQGEIIGLSEKGKININTASVSELDSLWGIGEKRAQDIIGNRPFEAIEELRDKKIIPTNVFERIKEEISII